MMVMTTIPSNLYKLETKFEVIIATNIILALYFEDCFCNFDLGRIRKNVMIIYR